MALPAGLVDAVLLQLGLAAAPAIDLGGLRNLYRAWCEKVPFDNVLKILHLTESWPGPLPGSTAIDFFRSWIEYRTGGTCWAGNGALYELVCELGFRAERASATMMSSPDTPGPNHGTVIVSLDDGRYVVDASILSGEPLRLPDDGEPADSTALPRVDVVGGTPTIVWRTLRAPDGFPCRIERVGVSGDEWHALHQRTAVWSPFNFALSARLNRGQDVLGFGLGQRFTFAGGGALSATPADRDERERFLVADLGIDPMITARLPEDRPLTPAPDGFFGRAS